MRTFIKNYIDAKKRQKLEETGEEGFSLIELIIVVVILGILVAIAIPIFLGLQDTARENAAKAVAATAVTQAAGQVAQGDTIDVANLIEGNTTAVSVSGTTLDTLCGSATVDGVTQTSGPGCTP